MKIARSAKVSLLALGFAVSVLVGASTASALYYADVYLPIGNSAGSTYVNDSAMCGNDPYSWAHSLAYSVESF